MRGWWWRNFTVQTSVRTFDAASYLRRCGADTALVKKLFSMDLSIKIKSMILADMKQVDEYMAFAVCPEGTADSQIIAGQVADFLVTGEDTVQLPFLLRRTDSAFRALRRFVNADCHGTAWRQPSDGGGSTVRH